MSYDISHTESDSERTLSASDDEERDWVMDGVQPRGRKRQRKGRKGSTSGSLARKIGRKSSKARQLLVKVSCKLLLKQFACYSCAKCLFIVRFLVECMFHLISEQGSVSSKEATTKWF